MPPKKKSGKPTQADLQRAAERAVSRAVKKGGATRVALTETPAKKSIRSHFLFRFRYQVAPIAAMVAVWVFGYVAYGMQNAARTCLVLGGLVAAGAYFGTRRWLDRPIERVYLVSILVSVAVWLALVTSSVRHYHRTNVIGNWFVSIPMGPSARETGWLLLCGVLISIPWWNHYKIRNTAKADTSLAEQWIENVGGTHESGLVLPGSYLVNVKKIPRGQEATIMLPGKKTTVENAVAATSRVESALDLVRGSVIIEQTADQIASRARLMIVTENATHAIREFGPDWTGAEKGCVRIGMYPDGEYAWSRIWRPGSGPAHALFSGDTGGGKSRGMELDITQAVLTGRVVSWVCDPQGGQSLPAWAGPDGVADWAATDMDEIHLLLQAASRIMYARSRVLAKRPWTDEHGKTRRGVDFFDPDKFTDMPILNITIDEAHSIFDRDGRVKDLVEEIAKMARKTGIRLVLGTQYPSAQQLGDSMAIRQQLAAGTVVAFKNSGTSTAQMILPATAMSPKQIPKLLPNGEDSVGTAVMDSSAPNGTRGIYFRTVWVRDAHGWAERAAEKMAKLDDLSVAAAGEDYATWRSRRDQEDINDIEAAFAMPSRGDVKFRRSTADTQKDTVAQKILVILRDSEEPVTRMDLMNNVGASGTAVGKALNKLQESDQVRSVGRGSWEAIR
jgi:hypothetical protein